jgi:hypothetical protein
MRRRGLHIGLFAAVFLLLAAPAEAATYTLTVTTTAGGAVAGGSGLNPNSINCGPNSTGDCSDDYSEILVPQTVFLTATPLPGWRFVSWTGCSSTNGTQCNRLMNADRTVGAAFANDPPTVTLTSPTPPAFSTVSGDVPLAATATDDSGVVEVTFWARLIQGGTTFLMRIGTDTTEPYEAVWHTRLLDNGFHGIVVRAEDAAGARGEDARDITIANPNGVRYAAPGANGADPCLQTDPCELVHAVRHAVSGDEVVVLPGDYALPNGLFVNRRVDIHGVSGQPRPRLLSAGGFGALVFQTPASLSHLYIEATQDDATGVLASTFGTPVLSDLVVVVSGQSTRAISIEDGNALIRDSVGRAPGANGIALSAGGAGTVDVRNVTASATGANSVGLMVAGCDATLDPCVGGARTLTARNVVARGTLYDLSATTNSPTYPGTINVSHSNYRPGAVNVSAGAAVNNQGNNQSAEPLFSNAAAGDFHQLPGSPTIDAGRGDDKIGPTDFDGQPRTLGTAPDIGADEFVPLAAPPLPAGSAVGDCTIQGTSGNDTLIGTRGNDVICAGAGKDTVRGLGGNDVIRLGAGNDKGYGGAGKDRILGGKGRDRLVGGKGRDTLNGGPGRDVCIGLRDVKRSC